MKIYLFKFSVVLFIYLLNGGFDTKEVNGLLRKRDKILKRFLICVSTVVFSYKYCKVWLFKWRCFDMPLVMQYVLETLALYKVFIFNSCEIIRGVKVQWLSVHIAVSSRKCWWDSVSHSWVRRLWSPSDWDYQRALMRTISVAYGDASSPSLILSSHWWYRTADSDSVQWNVSPDHVAQSNPNIVHCWKRGGQARMSGCVL